MADTIGSVQIVISGDTTKFQADLARAAGIAQTAGAKIATSLTSGMAPAVQGASLLVDQFGRAIQGEATVAAAAVPKVEALTAATRSLGAAHGAAVTQIQATSGAIRVLEGSGGLRAAERFLTMIPGVGAALTGIFPLVGLIAVGELISRAVEHFSKISEAEKKATEDAKAFNEEMVAGAKRIGDLNVEIARLQGGSVQGAGQAFLNAAADAKKAQDALDKASSIRRGGTEQTISGRKVIMPAHVAPGTEAPSPAELLKLSDAVVEAKKTAQVKELELNKALADQRKKEQQDATSDLKQADEDELADLKSKHQINFNEEISFWSKKLAAESSNADRSREISRTLGNLWQEQDKSFARMLEHGARLQEEQAKKAEQQKEKLEAIFREAGDIIDKQAADSGARGAKIADIRSASGARIGEIGAAGAGESADLKIQAQKIALEGKYGAEIAHTKGQEIAYLNQIAALDARARQAKIDGLKAEQDILKAQADQIAMQSVIDGDSEQGVQDAEREARAREKIAELEQRIAQLTQESANANATAKNKANQKEQQGSFGAQLGGGVSNALGSALAKGITDGGKNIGKDITNSLKSLGGQLFKSVFDQLIGVVIANTIATEANTIVTAVKGLLGFADGGRPPVGVPSIVGERGPELFLPDQAGTIVPAGKFGSAALASVGLPSSSFSNSSSAFSIGQLHVHGVTDARQFAEMAVREIPQVLKARGSQWSPYGG